MKNIILTEPLGYLDFLSLLLDAKFVLTDSGGLQEETTALNIPCITLRKNTERPITVQLGTNTVTGINGGKVLSLVKSILRGKVHRKKIPRFWDGKTAERIVRIIESKVSS